MSPGPVRVLSNIHLPNLDGYAVRGFRDYPGSGPVTWDESRDRRLLSAILAEIPGAEQPDVLVLGRPEYLPIPLDLATFRGLKILLITDWNVCLRFLPDLCRLFDYCFTDWPGFRILRQMGVSNVHHQPLFGHDPAKFRNAIVPRDLEVSFCGNLNGGMHGERNRLLFRLARWGAGRPIHLDQAFGPAYVNILNRSRLVFNWAIRGEANMRLYEAMACGAVPLVEDSNQEVPRLFQEGAHYFGYAPDRLESTLDSLLADPARIEAVSQAAQAAVAGHTRAIQCRAFLDYACRDGLGRRVEAPAPDLETRGRKALVKMRVLGTGFTLEESLTELQTQGALLPGLDVETFPAFLLSILEKEPDKPLELARSLLGRYLGHAALPTAIRHFLGMGWKGLQGDWPGVLAEADLTLKALEVSDPALPDPYPFFLSPVEAAQAMNGDVNRAYQEDAVSGGYRAYRELLRAHCSAMQARAALALGKPAEAIALGLGVSKGRWASADAHGVLVEAALRLKDRDKVRAYIYEWFADRPMDSGIWNRGVSALLETGDRRALAEFLAEVLVLADHFLKVSLKFSRK